MPIFAALRIPLPMKSLCCQICRIKNSFAINADHADIRCKAICPDFLAESISAFSCKQTFVTTAGSAPEKGRECESAVEGDSLLFFFFRPLFPLTFDDLCAHCEGVSVSIVFSFNLCFHCGAASWVSPLHQFSGISLIDIDASFFIQLW